MALVPIINQTWDTTSYVNPTRMNTIENNIAIAATAEGTKYSNGVSVKDKIDDVDEKLKGSVLSGTLANNSSKLLDGTGVRLIYIYRASTGLFALISQYNDIFNTQLGALPNTITLENNANGQLKITSTAGYNIGYTVINNPWT